ncbi:hypothetical protein O6H91_03G036500 [Diphasiastrum complanatum]|uniref:Uncharacterized protein n=1 Tax=Diphasiastrum complanatum TaxID=34168 RepID=A0ACC2E4X9_DIPCM|nr:hypothetical protein O6H91_03G036500 [Diphasiastrum complanatum]
MHLWHKGEREKQALKFIEEVTSNAAEVQLNILSTILERNAHTEYLNRHGLHGRTDRKSFKECLPVITYEDLGPEIQRIANGDTSPILSAHPISEFLTSSGTSARQRKLMPTISEELERRCLLYSLLMPVMNQYLSDLDKGKGMYLFFVKSEARTPGGLLTRPVLTSYYKSRYFIDRPYDPYNVYTSPNETVLCSDAHQSMYCQLLCGLVQKSEVLRMGAIFASGFLRAIRFLEQHWEEFCEDIRRGELNDCITDSAARTAYIDVIVTGTMAQYIPTLDYYSGGLPLVCNMYASSECYFGLNLNPLCPPSQVSYTLLPNMAYFEFLPVHNNKQEDDLCRSVVISKTTSPQITEDDELVELVDVEMGKEYELVITTYAGLYRYRVGDILRVTEFHNAAPQFAFVCRKNVVLSIDSDKTGEEDLQIAVKNASKELERHNTRLIEYTSYADTTTIPGHYVLYWELRSSSIRPLESGILQDCCLTVEESLDSVYRQGRVADKSIGPLEIKVVKPGTFDQLMDYALSRGASINQYKTPRCIKSAPILELLNARVLQNFFSRGCPRWSPIRPQWIVNQANGNGNHI